MNNDTATKRHSLLTLTVEEAAADLGVQLSWMQAQVAGDFPPPGYWGVRGERSRKAQYLVIADDLPDWQRQLDALDKEAREKRCVRDLRGSCGL